MLALIAAAALSLNAGPTKVLDSGADKVPVCVNDAVWDEMHEAATNKDYKRLAEMVRDGDVILVKRGTKAKVVEEAVFSCKVQVLAGPHKGKKGWVDREFLKDPE